MEEKILKELKEKLEKEKNILEQGLSSFAKKDERPEGDWDTKYPEFEAKGKLEEEASEEEQYISRLPVEHTLELRLKNVDLALEKIKKGKYGICEKCKKEISIERLKAIPEANLCQKCQTI